MSYGVGITERISEYKMPRFPRFDPSSYFPSPTFKHILPLYTDFQSQPRSSIPTQPKTSIFKHHHNAFPQIFRLSHAPNHRLRRRRAPHQSDQKLADTHHRGHENGTTPDPNPPRPGYKPHPRLGWVFFLQQRRVRGTLLQGYQRGWQVWYVITLVCFEMAALSLCGGDAKMTKWDSDRTRRPPQHPGYIRRYRLLGLF